MFFKNDEDKKTSKGLIAGVTVGIAFLGYCIYKKKTKPIMSFHMRYDKDEESETKVNDEKRKYYLVYQNTDYNEEKERGFIWARKSTESGRTIFHWENVNKINKEDIVFSLVDRKIVSLNIARDNSFDYSLEDIEGYRADLEYNELENPIDVDKYMDRILELSPEKYAPFNVMGRSNSGYLFDIGVKLGEYLLEVVRDNDLS